MAYCTLCVLCYALYDNINLDLDTERPRHWGQNVCLMSLLSWLACQYGKTMETWQIVREGESHCDFSNFRFSFKFSNRKERIQKCTTAVFQKAKWANQKCTAYTAVFWLFVIETTFQWPKHYKKWSEQKSKNISRKLSAKGCDDKKNSFSSPIEKRPWKLISLVFLKDKWKKVINQKRTKLCIIDTNFITV